MSVELENPLVLLYDGKLSSVNDLLPLLESISQQSRSLLLIVKMISMVNYSEHL